MEEYDLVIVGGGPGGYPLALRMAKHGWKTALVEADSVGGTCLNLGCIPTKALLASAKRLHGIRQAESFGLSVSGVSFDWEKVMTRKENVVRQLGSGIQKLLKSAGVNLIHGKGTLTGPGTVLIKGTEEISIKGKKVCLATGSVPAVPGPWPQDRSILWTSNEALSATKIPESLLVIGGGVIGLELGQVFAEFGSKVTVVEMMPQILPGLDSTTAKRLMPVFKKAGLDILAGTKVESLTIEQGRICATIGGQKRTFEKGLVAAGRKPNLSFTVENGPKPTLSGNQVQVSEGLETSLPGIFAIGDLVRGPMLAHKATYDAMILAKRFMGQAVNPDYSAVPSCVYTYPEIAWVGMSEEEAKAAGKEFTTGRFLFSANGKALASGDSDGQVKVLRGTDGKLLGAVIWGPEASNLILEPTILEAMKIDLSEFLKVIHPHPTLSEAFFEGVAGACGEAVHG